MFESSALVCRACIKLGHTHNTSRRSKVLLNGSEQLYHSVHPRLSLLLVADLSQCLSSVHQGQHRPLKVLPAQRSLTQGELCRQAANVGEPLGQDIVTYDLQLLHAPQGGQLLIWDQHGVLPTLDLHSSLQDLGDIKENTQKLSTYTTKQLPVSYHKPPVTPTYQKNYLFTSL